MKRDASIDILRGYATILVIIGHIPYTPILLRFWIYTFHVPLFFLCSGILFSPERYPRFKDFFLSRVKGLLLPILSLGLLLRLLQIAVSGLLSLLPEVPAEYAIPFDPLQQLLRLVLGWRVHVWYYSFWFLYTLFLSELLFYFLVKLIRKRWYVYVLMIAGGIALQYLVSGYVKGFIWSADLIPAGLSFISAGYLYRILFYEKQKKLPPFLLPVFLAVSFLLTRLNYNGEQVNLFYGQLGNPVFYIICALAGCCASIILADLIQRSRILEFFGRNSLLTYAFQNTVAIPFFMELLRLWRLRNPFASERSFKMVITLAGTLLLSAAFCLAVNRFAPWLIGKKRKKKEQEIRS